jgi:hypothetical protein
MAEMAEYAFGVSAYDTIPCHLDTATRYLMDIFQPVIRILALEGLQDPN